MSNGANGVIPSSKEREQVRKTLDKCITSTACTVGTLMMRYCDLRLQELNLPFPPLSMSQFLTLASIYIKPNITAAALARLLMRDHTTTYRSLCILDKGGYIAFEESEMDKRLRLITVTEAGANAVRLIIPEWHKIQQQIKQRLRPWKTADLLPQLDGISHALFEDIKGQTKHKYAQGKLKEETKEGGENG